MLVADTDFLSAFIKIGSIGSILEVFEEDKIVIPVQVKEELLKELEENINDNIEVKNIEPIQRPELGKGERAAIALASETDLLLMNDRKACQEAKQHDLKTVTIPGFLKLADKKLKQEEIQEIADKLRDKDNYLFSKEEKKELGLN